MSIKKRNMMGEPMGATFILHQHKTGEEIRMNIPRHEDWYWGQMPDGTNYVCGGGCAIRFIKESYQEFWKARCEAYNQYYRLGKYMV